MAGEDATDFRIIQGDLFQRIVAYQNPDETPIDVTGYTAKLQIRRQAASPTALITLTVGSGIEINDDGEFAITLSGVQTAALPDGISVYGFEVYPGGDEELSETLLRGRIRVIEDVTHD